LQRKTQDELKRKLEEAQAKLAQNRRNAPTPAKPTHPQSRGTPPKQAAQTQKPSTPEDRQTARPSIPAYPDLRPDLEKAQESLRDIQQLEDARPAGTASREI
jgi:paraquat-inducible protein B